MNESTKRILGLILNTLDQVEVKGEDNLDKLLACIQTLHTLIEGDEKDGLLDSNGNSDAC